MGLTLRERRLRLAWILALPFLLLARPSPPLLLTGAGIAAGGLLLRAWAAAHIHKDRALASAGPYARMRHPLWAGSLLVGVGLSVAGGRWFFPPLFLALFLVVYGQAVREEERGLEARFGEAYRSYRARTPAFLPRPLWRAPFPRADSPPSPASPASGLPLYRRNKEWQAALGAAAGFLLLWVRMVLAG